MCMKKSAAAQEIASWRKMSASYEEARPQSVSCWCRVSFLAWRHHENLAMWLPLSSHSSLGCPLFWHQPFPIRRKDSPRFWTVFLLLGPEKERMSVFPKQESFCGILQPSVTIHFTSQDFLCSLCTLTSSSLCPQNVPEIYVGAFFLHYFDLFQFGGKDDGSETQWFVILELPIFIYSLGCTKNWFGFRW